MLYNNNNINVYFSLSQLCALLWLDLCTETSGDGQHDMFLWFAEKCWQPRFYPVDWAVLFFVFFALFLVSTKGWRKYLDL